MLSRFIRSEDGTDLVEYSLLLAFICLASAAVVIGAGQITSGLWAITNTRLASAAVSSS
jgi:Flp pilus assembly pilin Flp